MDEEEKELSGSTGKQNRRNAGVDANMQRPDGQMMKNSEIVEIR